MNIPKPWWLTVIAAVLFGVWAFGKAPATAQSGAQVIVVILQTNASEKDISLGLVRRIFRGEPTEFGGSRMVPFSYSPDSSVRRVFDQLALNMSPDQVGAYWIDRRIRGQGMAPRTVPSPQIMKAVIAKLPGSIGYVSAEHLDASVQPLTIDGKSYKSADYPLRLR
jgi:ABC-type phosphate transport system substrate-binding protein